MFPSISAEVPNRGIICDTIHRKNIYSVTLTREGWPLSLPLVNQQEQQQLLLSFDELSQVREEYSWEIIHCNQNWMPDDLAVQEFLDGFPDYEVSDAQPSFNTTASYWSYQVVIPGPDIRWQCSGNFVVRVFLSGYPDSTLFTRRFMVSEGRSGITVRQLPLVGEEAVTSQQLEVQADIREAGIGEEETVNLVVLQNYRWKFVHRSRMSTRGRGFLTSLPGAPMTFEGGNEFLNVDLKNLKYVSGEISNIFYKYPFYRVLARPDPYDPYKGYRFANDLDGKYLIQCDGTNSSRTDADYAEVHFSVPVSFPFEGDIFISGDFSLNSFDPAYKMSYDTLRGTYEISLLIKQGFYTYEYILTDKTGHRSYTQLGGSYAETQNEYLILLYYADKQRGYDRLTGYTLFNTLHQNR
ncbi:MAG: DUF5103 domain-containing protein [Bacteroidales bacterium]